MTSKTHEMRERDELTKIRKTIAAIREDVLPVGHTVNASITLATCHGDLDYIERHLDRLEKSIRADEQRRIREALMTEEVMWAFDDAHQDGSFNDGVAAMLSHIGIDAGQESEGQNDE